jgi:hypothetical protein
MFYAIVVDGFPFLDEFFEFGYKFEWHVDGFCILNNFVFLVAYLRWWTDAIFAVSEDIDVAIKADVVAEFCIVIEVIVLTITRCGDLESIKVFVIVDLFKESFPLCVAVFFVEVHIYDDNVVDKAG